MESNDMLKCLNALVLPISAFISGYIHSRWYRKRKEKRDRERREYVSMATN